MITREIQFDHEHEDDGLYTITFWLYEDPPAYITLARDDHEDPHTIYFESLDQKYGFNSAEINYSLNGDTLFLYLPQNQATWDGEKTLSINIPKQKISDVAQKLIKIFNTTSV